MIVTSTHRNIMPDSSATGETGGKSATGRDRAHMSRMSRSSRLSRDSAISRPPTHEVWSSRVESAIEMSLGDFIDPAHQGGHAHGSLFGDGKL